MRSRVRRRAWLLLGEGEAGAALLPTALPAASCLWRDPLRAARLLTFQLLRL